MRLHVESMLHQESCFVTLTYNQENIPYGNSLVPEDLTRFVKRLRFSLGSKRIRYYGVGEYGGVFKRPHYHILVFGHNFSDRRVYLDRGTYTVDNSRSLEKLWEYGYSTVQDASIECAAYVSKYTVKKITGEKSVDHYTWVDEDTGEIHHQVPEFARMSRRPGIGHDWMLKYHQDVFPKGFTTDGKGRKIPPPEYFNKLYEKWFPEEMARLRDERKEEIFEQYMDYNVQKLEAREAIQRSKTNLKRNGDNKA